MELRRCRQVEPTFWVVVGCFKAARLQDHKWAVAGLLFPKTGQNGTKQDKTGQTVKVCPEVVVILQCQSKWLIKQKNQIACTDSTL